MKMSEAVGVLGALAQESRLEIFRYLIRMGPQGLPAGRIGDELEFHSATLSFHLNALKHAGLIESRRESRSNGVPSKGGWRVHSTWIMQPSA